MADGIERAARQAQTIGPDSTAWLTSSTLGESSVTATMTAVRLMIMLSGFSAIDTLCSLRDTKYAPKEHNSR